MIQIYYDIDTARRVNMDNAPITTLLQLYYDTVPQIQFNFLSNGEPVDLSGMTAWRAAIDTEFDVSTTPVCRTDSAGIDASNAAQGVIIVTFDCRTAEFLSKLNSQQRVNAWLDLYGINSAGNSEFIAQMQCLLYSVIDPEQGTPPIVPDLYPSVAAVQGMINAAVADLVAKIEAKHIFQYSSDGTNWHDTFQTGDTYMRERANFEGAEWSDAYPISPPTVFADAVEFNFETTDGMAAELVLTNSELGIAEDAQPNVTLWHVETDNTLLRVADTTYNAKWGEGYLSLTYYQTWIAGNWQLKLG